MCVRPHGEMDPQLQCKVVCVINRKGMADNRKHSRFFFLIQQIKNKILRLPQWYSGQEPACQCRGHRFDFCSRKSPQAAGQLSPMPQLLSPSTQTPCSATREATAMRSPRTTTKSSLPLPATRESPCTATKTQRTKYIHTYFLSEIKQNSRALQNAEQEQPQKT